MNVTRGKSKLPLKIAVGVVLAIGVGFLFVRSARNARATPYTISRAALQAWRVSIEPAGGGPGSAVLLLSGSGEIVSGLADQLFARAMESLQPPRVAGIPLVLRDEMDRAFTGRADPETLAATAIAAGVGASPPEPRCLGYRRLSTKDGTRQLYFLIFDAPAFVRFRAQLAALATPGALDPAALSPVMIVAGSDTAFESWQPLRVDPATDCIAPIELK